MIHHEAMLIENEYKGQLLRQQAEAHRLAKEARASQRAARQVRSSIGIGYIIQLMLVTWLDFPCL